MVTISSTSPLVGHPAMPPEIRTCVAAHTTNPRTPDPALDVGELESHEPKPTESPTPYAKSDTQLETNSLRPSRPWSVRSPGLVPSMINVVTDRLTCICPSSRIVGSTMPTTSSALYETHTN
ncbi:hypothetical protein PIB30_069620 [Stylosanthes scabra]|uniref:Uncharacterized protein n=1 Tax=Stylosanthes scabra TaxID=79078 RepID=A0ABU6WR27_9FABA|nr:hypothetical protein [Stylosanthes scabra]